MEEAIDILQPVKDDGIKSMMKVLKASLPKSIRGHHFLYNYIKNIRTNEISSFNGSELPDRCRIVIYSPNKGDAKNCTYISISAFEDYWIFLYTLEESGKELSQCLKETKRIDWGHAPITISVEGQHFGLVDKIVRQKHSMWCYDTPEGIYFLPRKTVLAFPINTPKNTYLDSLKPEHAELINENWPHKYHASLSLLKMLIRVMGGTGLFKSETNELIAWAVTNDFFCPGFWHTIESERGKGYGTIVYKAECKRLVELNDIDILAYIVRGNAASEYILTSLGFELVGELKWIERC